MDVQLKEDKKFVNNLKLSKDYEIFLYFIRITNKKNSTVIKLSFNEELEEEFINLFLNLDENIPQDIFLPSKDGENYYKFDYLEKVVVDSENQAEGVYKYPIIQNLINTIDKDSDSILDKLNKIKLHNLSGYAVKIKKKNSDERILYFSQFEKFTALKKGLGIMTNVTNDNVSEINKENAVGLKPYINCYIGKQNKLLVTLKNNFENMFKMGDIYIEEAERILNSIPDLTSTFSNYDEFNRHVKKDARLSKRVASLEFKTDRVKLVCSNINLVKNAINEPEYKEKIGKVKIENDKIVYEKENIDQIITLLSDLAAESYITKKRFVAESD